MRKPKTQEPNTKNKRHVAEALKALNLAHWRLKTIAEMLTRHDDEVCCYGGAADLQIAIEAIRSTSDSVFDAESVLEQGWDSKKRGSKSTHRG